MTSYLLLRDNKESGPFSLEELVSKGLKAYDLVWANGKSAAWRYPGEIEELKAFAPPVEEQPYDRFFKKPSEQPQVENVHEKYAPQPAVSRAQSVVGQDYDRFSKTADEKANFQPQPINEPVAEAIMPQTTEAKVDGHPEVPKKSVFVTMPRRQAPANTDPEPKPVPSAPQPISRETVANGYEKYQPASREVKEPVEQPAKTITITENPVAAEIKYSQPLDEIKEMYVKTLQERKQRMANKAFFLQAAKKVAVVLAIVGAGILIGFTIKSNSVKKMLAASSGVPKQQIAPQQLSVNPGNEEQVPTDESVAENQPAADETFTEKSNTEENPPQEDNSKANKIVARESTPEMKRPNVVPPASSQDNNTEKITEVQTQKAESLPTRKKEPINETANPGVDVNSRTGERSRKVRNTNAENDEPAETKEATPEAPVILTDDDDESEAYEPKRELKGVTSVRGLTKLVSVKSNAYKIVAFGGIRDLHITVVNDSKYMLDKVMVELEYLKPTEEPFRMDVIQFKSVSPGGSLTIRMPDTNRGVKVKYKIVQILSTQAARDVAGL